MHSSVTGVTSAARKICPPTSDFMKSMHFYIFLGIFVCIIADSKEVIEEEMQDMQQGDVAAFFFVQTKEKIHYSAKTCGVGPKHNTPMSLSFQMIR